MGGGIILDYIKIHLQALNKYRKCFINEIAGILTIFTFAAFYPPMHNLIITNFIILLIILVIGVIIHFYLWKKKNFNSLTINFDSLILIEGKNDNHLSFNISELIIPSEDSLLLTLKLEFDEIIKSNLFKKSYYTLIFKKPHDLEINFKNNTKIKYVIAADGLESPFYCIIIENKNNSVDNLLFELEAGNEMKGNMEIYFFIGYFENDFEEKISKKSPVFNEKVCSRDINIDDGECITIDRRA